VHDDDPDDLPEAERIVVLELGDVVDLHGFRPGDVREVVLAALDAASSVPMGYPYDFMARVQGAW